MVTKSKEYLIKEAMSGNIGSIYDLMTAYPKCPEIRLLKTVFKDKISSEIDIAAGGDVAMYSLRDHLRGDSGLTGRVLMYFKNKAIAPVRISGELYFTDEQYNLIVASNNRVEKEQFSDREGYGNSGGYIHVPNEDRYINYLGLKEEFKDLMSVCPRSIMKSALESSVTDLLYDRAPSPESYQFNSIQFNSVVKNMDNLDFIQVTERGIDKLKIMSKVTESLIVSGFGFVDIHGKGVIVRESSEGGVLDRVLVSPI